MRYSDLLRFHAGKPMREIRHTLDFSFHSTGPNFGLASNAPPWLQIFIDLNEVVEEW